jgi:hypothetical protein
MDAFVRFKDNGRDHYLREAVEEELQKIQIVRCLGQNNFGAPQTLEQQIKTQVNKKKVSVNRNCIKIGVKVFTWLRVSTRGELLKAKVRNNE